MSAGIFDIAFDEQSNLLVDNNLPLPACLLPFDLVFIRFGLCSFLTRGENQSFFFSSNQQISKEEFLNLGSCFPDPQWEIFGSFEVTWFANFYWSIRGNL